MKNNANLTEDERLLINPTDHKGQKIVNWVLAVLGIFAFICAGIYFPIIFSSDKKIALNEVSKLGSFVDKIQLTKAVENSFVFTDKTKPLVVSGEGLKELEDGVAKAAYLENIWKVKDAFIFTDGAINSNIVAHELFHKVDKDSGNKFSQSVSKAATECDDLFKRKKAIINEDGVIKFIDGKEFASANFSDAENKRYFSCWTITKAVKDVNSDSYYKTLSTEEKQAEIAAISFATLATQTEEKLLDKEVLDVAFPNMFILKK